VRQAAPAEITASACQNEGLRDLGRVPTFSKRFRAMRQRKAAPMSAEELKRKLRNFPTAKLSERLAA
jgi:hypothetical protein